MLRIEHNLMAVVATAMAGDLLASVQDANHSVGCDEGKLTPYRVRRDGVIVEVEAHIDGLGRTNRQHQVGVERMRGQRQQTRLFFSEGFGYSAPIISRPWTPMGNLIPPQQGLAIALFQRGEAASSPEGFAHVTNSPFHAALLVSGAHLARTCRAVIVSAQLHQTGMEVDLIATSLKYGTAQIIVQNDSRYPRPSLEGVDMAAQEVLHGLVEEKLQIQRSRVGQGDDKAGQTSAGASDPDFAKVRPVDLRLIALKHVKAQERLYSPGTQIGNDAAQLNHAALIPTVSNHLVDARGAKLWILFQSLADEGQIRIGQAAAQRLSTIEAVRFNRMANRIGMDSKFVGNRADLPVFGEKQMPNLHTGFCADHRDILKSWDLGKRIDETTRPATPDTTKKGRTLLVRLLRHTGNARVNAKAAAGTLLVAVIADLDSHEGILRGEEIEAEP